LRNGDWSWRKSRGWHLLRPNKGQKSGKIWVKFNKSSSHELVIQILWYLTYSILGKWFVKYAHKNKIHPKTKFLSCYLCVDHQLLNKGVSEQIKVPFSAIYSYTYVRQCNVRSAVTGPEASRVFICKHHAIDKHDTLTSHFILILDQPDLL